MTDLIPSMNQALEVQPPVGGVVRPRTRREMRDTGERALVQSAEVIATEFVASAAMMATARTTMDELHWSRELPDYSYRFRRIGDLQAMNAARCVQEMG